MKNRNDENFRKYRDYQRIYKKLLQKCETDYYKEQFVSSAMQIIQKTMAELEQTMFILKKIHQDQHQHQQTDLPKQGISQTRKYM